VCVCGWLVQEKTSVRTADKSPKIAKELSDLVVYCQPITFDWDIGRLSFFFRCSDILYLLLLFDDKHLIRFFGG